MGALIPAYIAAIITTTATTTVKEQSKKRDYKLPLKFSHISFQSFPRTALEHIRFYSRQGFFLCGRNCIIFFFLFLIDYFPIIRIHSIEKAQEKSQFWCPSNPQSGGSCCRYVDVPPPVFPLRFIVELGQIIVCIPVFRRFFSSQDIMRIFLYCKHHFPSLYNSSSGGSTTIYISIPLKLEI